MNLIIESIGKPIEKDFSSTVVAHARNSVILSDIIDADIVTGDQDIHITEGKTYENIICSYASPYMKYKMLIDVVRNNPNAKLWWFVNDHDLEDNILLRNVLKETDGDRHFSMVCNNSREGYRSWVLNKKMKNSKGELMGLLNDFIDEWYTLNLNALIYNYHVPFDWKDKQQGLNLLGENSNESIYYGTMRKWRMEDFVEYQKADIVFSATQSTQRKLVNAGVMGYRFVPKLSWERGKEDMNKYMFSLYMEDEHTHDNYAHMANRFYEGLMFNNITLFDSKCQKTIDKSNFDIDDMYIVDGAEEYMDTVSLFRDKKTFEDCLETNNFHKSIAEVEHRTVVEQLRTIFL